MKRGIALLVVVALTLPVAVLAGCGGTTTAKARQEFRTDLQDFEDSLKNLADVNASTSIEDFKSNLNAVGDVWDAVKESAKKVKEVQFSDLEKAYNDLQKAVKDISGTEKLGEATINIIAALAEVELAVQALLSKIGTE